MLVGGVRSVSGIGFTVGAEAFDLSGLRLAV